VVSVVVVVGAVDLRPVEADHPLALGPVLHRDEEAGGVEPRLAHPHVEVLEGPAALVGQVDEGGRVQREPLVVVEAGEERAQPHVVGETGRREGREQRAAHLPEDTAADEPERCRQRCRTTLLAVRPEA